MFVLQVSHINHSEPDSSAGEQVQLKLNIDSVIEDIKIMGKGLVTSIEINNTWSMLIELLYSLLCIILIVQCNLSTVHNIKIRNWYYWKYYTELLKWLVHCLKYKQYLL